MWKMGNDHETMSRRTQTRFLEEKYDINLRC